MMHIVIVINEFPEQEVGYVYRCPFGSGITNAFIEGSSQTAGIDGKHVYLPPGTPHVSISYE